MKQTTQRNNQRTLLVTLAIAGIALGITAAVIRRRKKKDAYYYALLDEHEHAIGGY